MARNTSRRDLAASLSSFVQDRLSLPAPDAFADAVIRKLPQASPPPDDTDRVKALNAELEAVGQRANNAEIALNAARQDASKAIKAAQQEAQDVRGQYDHFRQFGFDAVNPTPFPPPPIIAKKLTQKEVDEFLSILRSVTSEAQVVDQLNSVGLISLQASKALPVGQPS